MENEGVEAPIKNENTSLAECNERNDEDELLRIIVEIIVDFIMKETKHNIVAKVEDT